MDFGEILVESLFVTKDAILVGGRLSEKIQGWNCSDAERIPWPEDAQDIDLLFDFRALKSVGSFEVFIGSGGKDSSSNSIVWARRRPARG